LLKSQN